MSKMQEWRYWEVTSPKTNDGSPRTIKHVIKSGGCVVATFDYAGPAQLGAAAPDLLAACEALLNCIDPARDWNEAKAARAAIAKAKGGAA